MGMRAGNYIVWIGFLGLIFGFSGCKSEASPASKSNPTPMAESQDPHRAELQRLSSLGYLAGVRSSTSNRTGVTVSKLDQVMPGYTLFTSGHSATAFLIDQSGQAVHSWYAPFEKLFPDYKVPSNKVKRERTTYWRYALLLPEGELLVIFEGSGIAKLDRASKVIWARLNHAHHEAQILADGNIAVLTREAKVRGEYAVLLDYLSILDSAGQEIERFDLLEAIQNSPLKDKFFKPKKRIKNDFLHTNSIQELGTEVVKFVPGAKAGNILLSFRNLNAIGVLDRNTRQMIWAFKDKFKKHHYPRILADGTLLIFDNLGAGNKSRILQYDLKTNQLKNSIDKLADGSGFYTRSMGLADPLPNGNLLVIDSEAGRIFEINQRNELVWDFYTPYRVGEKDEFVAVIGHAKRESTDKIHAWLKK